MINNKVGLSGFHAVERPLQNVLDARYFVHILARRIIFSFLDKVGPGIPVSYALPTKINDQNVWRQIWNVGELKCFNLRYSITYFQAEPILIEFPQWPVGSVPQVKIYIHRTPLDVAYTGHSGGE